MQCECEFLLKQISFLQADLETLRSEFNDFLFDFDQRNDNIFDLINAVENLDFSI